MNDAPVEFMHSANVVEMRVSGYGRNVLVEDVFRSRLQACDSEPRIDEHIPAAAFHMPDIASNEGVYMGFPQ